MTSPSETMESRQRAHPSHRGPALYPTDPATFRVPPWLWVRGREGGRLIRADQIIGVRCQLADPNVDPDVADTRNLDHVVEVEVAGLEAPVPVAIGVSFDDADAIAEELLYLIAGRLAAAQPGFVVWDGPQSGLVFLGWELP